MHVAAHGLPRRDGRLYCKRCYRCCADGLENGRRLALFLHSQNVYSLGNKLGLVFVDISPHGFLEISVICLLFLDCRSFDYSYRGIGMKSRRRDRRGTYP